MKKGEEADDALLIEVLKNLRGRVARAEFCSLRVVNGLGERERQSLLSC